MTRLILFPRRVRPRNPQVIGRVSALLVTRYFRASHWAVSHALSEAWETLSSATMAMVKWHAAIRVKPNGCIRL